MTVRIDHIVLWTDDPLRSVAFYERVVGLSGVRVEEYRAGTAPFPSVRVCDDSIIDLMPGDGAPVLNAVAGMEGSAGHPVNHVCLAMSRDDYDALRDRLEEHGVAELVTMETSFGARGHAPTAFYFADPDGNILEARHYS